jgi:polyphosphate kinase 2 (PPK2 family)
VIEEKMTRRRIKLDKLKRLPVRSAVKNDELLAHEQNRLTRIQQAYLFTGERGVVVFEGMDAAGKGGAIRRIAWAMDPRSLKVWPIGGPNEIEKRQHYLQRFWVRLPERSQISIFDRSWYGRVLVERVEQFASISEWRRAYFEINEFERQLVDSGFKIAKIFLHISKDEQLRRFEERLRDPLKRWKLTYEDFRNREKWQENIAAAEDMLARTNTKCAPWEVIPADDKPAARLCALRLIAERLSVGVDLGSPPIDAKLVRIARRAIGGAAPRAKI